MDDSRIIEKTIKTPKISSIIAWAFLFVVGVFITVGLLMLSPQSQDYFLIIFVAFFATMLFLCLALVRIACRLSKSDGNKRVLFSEGLVFAIPYICGVPPFLLPDIYERVSGYYLFQTLPQFTWVFISLIIILMVARSPFRQGIFGDNQRAIESCMNYMNACMVVLFFFLDILYRTQWFEEMTGLSPLIGGVTFVSAASTLAGAISDLKPKMRFVQCWHQSAKENLVLRERTRLRIQGVLMLLVSLVVVSLLLRVSCGFQFYSGPEERVEDYSWQQLSLLSKRMAEAQSDDEAFEMAKRFNLVTDKGFLDGTQVKQVSIKVGESTESFAAAIVGFRHDARVEDSTLGNEKKNAGITFALSIPDSVVSSIASLSGTENSRAVGKMSLERSNNGGWEYSAMRTWLADALLDVLSEEMTKYIVPVQKMTNNIGLTDVASSVTATNDKLWLFAEKELFGSELHGSTREASGVVLSAEGKRYPAFGNFPAFGIKSEVVSRLRFSQYDSLFECYAKTSERDNRPDVLAQILGLEETWMRSPDPVTSTNFFQVDKRNKLISVGADESCGLLIGFCL